MAKVVNVRVIDDRCATIKEYELDQPLDEETLNYMAWGSNLQIYPDTPACHFQIERNNAYVIQGTLGESKFRITFAPTATADMEERLQWQID